MGGARTAVLVVPPTIYLLSNFHLLAFAILQWSTGAILDATWTGLVSGGVRIYPEAGYRTAFGVCLGLAAGARVSTLFVTETRGRNLWRRAAH